MEIVKYSISEFRNKQNIKALLEKMGVPKELWDNNGENFWKQSKEDLKNVLEITKKIYKSLAIQLHPRALEDSDEEAKKLHSLMDAIEKRFEYKLNKEKIVPIFHENKVECMCGCGRSFDSYIAQNGEMKKYFSKKCSQRAKQQRRKIKLQRLKPLNPNIDFPLVECACGCGVPFRQIVRGTIVKKYFSAKCKKRVLSKKQYEKRKNFVNKETRSEKWKNYYKNRWGYKPKETAICECGCGQQFERINKGEKTRRFFSRKCQMKILNFKARQIRRERHENFKKILSGQI